MPFNEKRHRILRENPDIIQGWTNAIYKGQKWTEAAPITEIVKTIEPFFPGVDARALAAASERYRRLKIWKSTPGIEAKPIEKFQDILVEGHVLDPARRGKYQDLILPEFAAKAK